MRRLNLLQFVGVRVALALAMAVIVVGCGESNNGDGAPPPPAQAQTTTAAKPKPYKAQVTECLEGVAWEVTEDQDGNMTVASPGGRRIATS